MTIRTVASTDSSATLQATINLCAAGDVVELAAGGSWDGSFTLPAVAGASLASPVTIRSSNYISILFGRVSPDDAPNMARIRSLGGGTNGECFKLATNAAYWIIDSLELSDNAAHTAFIGMLIDCTDVTVNHITVQRCYLHQKETGTSYNRTVMRGIQFEGDTLLFKWNYLFIIGYYYPEVASGGSDHYQMDTCAVLSIGESHHVTIEDNYISVWWNQFFTGGGDTPPYNSANVTSATLTSATFDNTTGIEAGIVLRLEFVATGTFSATGYSDSCNNTFPANGPPISTGTQFVRSGGFTFTSGDSIHYGAIKADADAYDQLCGLCSVSGNNYTLARTRSTLNPSAGAATLTIYETVMVDTVNHSTGAVTYHAFGFNALASTGATKASWNYGDQGLVTDFVVRKNTFYNDPAFALDCYAQTGNSPKGICELKNVKRFTFDGNYVLGYPMILGCYPGNQYGTAVWTTAQDLVISNNWIAPDWYLNSSRETFGLIDASNYATITPLANLTVQNNFINYVSAFFYMKGADNWNVSHNTVINQSGSAHGYTAICRLITIDVPATNFVFTDNIVNFSNDGLKGENNNNSIDFPGMTMNHNVIVNVQGVPEYVMAPFMGGAGNYLMPIPATYNDVGFTDYTGQNYSLAASSPYKGAGNSGTDPGVNWTNLLAALPYLPSGAPSTPTVKVRGRHKVKML